jgi:hypothetical protein
MIVLIFNVGKSHSKATLKVGDVVGITADPISTSNVGHKMLLAMGNLLGFCVS